MASDEDLLDFDPEAYIVRENTNVVLTRNGRIKRVGRLSSIETTRVEEGDAVIAVVPGNTLDHVIFFADDGTAYTMRINEVPATTGYGEPITKFFRLGDGVKVVAAVTYRSALHTARWEGQGGHSARSLPARRGHERQRAANSPGRLPSRVDQSGPALCPGR